MTSKLSSKSRGGNQKLSKRKRRHESNSNNDSSDTETDITQELHPIGYYINDREEMIEQVFEVIKGAKLKAMLTSALRDLDLEELKELCLVQLEGMSKKRIKCILAGKEMEESSNTEDDEDDDEEADGSAAKHLHDLFKPANSGPKEVSSLGLKKGQQRNGNSLPPKAEALDSPEDFDDKENSESDDLDEDGFHKTSGRKKRKKISRSEENSKNKKKMKVNLKTKGKKKSDDRESQIEPIASDEKKGKTLMELLELEMRARAIKALLKKPGINVTKEESVSKEAGPSEEQIQEMKEKLQEEDEKKEKEVPDEETAEQKEEAQKELEKQKELQKAREALMLSEKKQKQVDIENESKELKIRKQMEAEQKAREEEEEKERKKWKELEEKERKKKKKEEEHQKFLKWKEERKKKEDLRRRLEEEVEEDMMIERAKMKLKEKEEELELAVNRRDAAEDVDIEIKKPTAEREEVIDEELDRGFQISFDYGTEGEEEVGAQKKRRYRKKAKAEEGEMEEESPVRKRSRSRTRSGSRSRSKSRSCSRESSISLTSSEDEEKTVEKLRQVREKKIAEIRNQKRKKKPAKDIEEGEVDSEGEHFEPIAEGEKNKAHSEDGEEESGDEVDLNKYDLSQATEGDPTEDHVSGVKEAYPDDNEKTEKGEIVKEPLRTTIPILVPGSIETITTDLNDKKAVLKMEETVKIQKESRRGSKHVLIKDDSDNEKILTSSEDEEKEDEETLSSKKNISQKCESLKEPIKNSPESGFKQGNEEEEEEDDAREVEEKETEEEQEIRERHENEDKKRLDKMERMRHERIKRMQAFQQRTEIQEEEEKHEEEEPIEEEPIEEMEEDEKRAEEASDFYKSFIEHEEKEKQDQEKKKKLEEQLKIEQQQQVILDEAGVKEDQKVSAGEKKEVAAEGKPKKSKGKSKEKKMLEGVGFWSRLCESQGDFEVPGTSEELDLENEGNDVATDEKRVEEKMSPTKENEPHATKRTRSRAVGKNKDLPTKEEVDRQQEELETVTWADRWYQNKKVKKVVKDSKMMSKVRTQIKLKEFKLKPVFDPAKASGSSDQDGEQLPKIIGSMEDYAKILGKKEELDPDKILENAKLPEEESEEEEEDDLWGDIMGSK